MSPSGRKPVLPAVAGRRLVLLAAGALGFSCVMTQLALMRELLGAFSGNELVLGLALGNWLLLMGIGAWLGRTSDKLQNPLAVLAVAQILTAVLPLAQVFLLRSLRNVVFVRGAAVGVSQTVLSSLMLLLPYCLIAGYALTLACSLLGSWVARATRPSRRATGPAEGPMRLLARALRLGCGSSSSVPVGESPTGTGGSPVPPNQRGAGYEVSGPAREEGAAGIGQVYVADSIGSIGGGVLFSFVLVRFLDHAGILVYPAVLNLLVAGVIGFRAGHRLLLTMAGALAAAVIASAFLADLDGVSTAMQYPGQRIVARANSPYGKLLVTESDGQFDFIENGVPLTSTRDDQRMEEAVHYAMAQRPEARQVLLVGGGISGTAKELLKYNVRRVDYVELDPLILEFGRKYLPQSLADSRIKIINTDGRLFVRQTAEKYEVVIVDVPEPSTAQLNRFFTVEFLAQVKRVLSSGGVLSFSLGHYENYVSPDLARMLASAGRSVKQTFPNILVIPGGKVFFLASDGPLYGNIAERIEQQGIKTKLMTRHYLDAMLAADRMIDMQHAIEQPAALNRDFNPVLYFYHLRHWMSQFNTGFGVLQVLLLALLCVYLVRLRGTAFVLFASGFAGTTLEIVLLLAFQVLCGSVYHQLGIIVTVFMAGLALGAALANRRVKPRSNGVKELTCQSWMVGRAVPCPPLEGSATLVPLPMSDGGQRSARPTFLGWAIAKLVRLRCRAAQTSLHPSIPPSSIPLSLLALAIAAYAILLAFLLPLLNRLGDTASSLGFIKAAIALLTLLLAVLAGMQFPLANRLEYDGTVAGASRLYTADFIGAFLGALLASALLIPLIGVTGVCLLTAALNIAAGAMAFPAKAPTLQSAA
jgi:spermidine synthase